MKFLKKLKNQITYLFLILTACLIGSAIALPKDNQTGAVNAVAESSATVYDYYDLTGNYFRSSNVDTMFLTNIEEADINDFSVRILVKMVKPDHAHIGVGFLLPESSTDSWGHGYWLGIDNTRGLALAHLSLGGVGDNIFNSDQSIRIGQHAKMSQMYEADGFILEFGARKVENGRYVFVKVDGVTVIEGVDTVQRTVGTRIIADTTARCNFATAKDFSGQTESVKAKDLDFYDWTGTYFRSNRVDTLLKTNLLVSDVDGFVLRTHVRIINENHSHIGFGILLPENAHDSYAAGYWLGFDKNKGLALICGSLGGVGDNVFNAPLGDLLGSCEKLEEVYAPEGFVLEFGAKKTGVGRYLFVKINGETVIDYMDFATRDFLGTKIIADTTYRCDFSTTKDIETEIENTTANVVDYYELTGDVVRENAKEGFELGTTATENVEFTARIALSEGHSHLPIGILAGDNANDTYTNAYWLDLRADGTLNLFPYGIYADGSGRKVASVCVKEQTQGETGFVLGFGVKNITHGKDDPVGRYIYVTVDGETVASYEDYSMGDVGNRVMSDITARATVYSTYLTWDEAKAYDWYDLTGSFSTEYTQLRKEYNTELIAGQFPTTEFINISMKANLTVGEEAWSGAGGFSLAILKSTDIVNDQIGTGYILKWSDRFYITAGNMWGELNRGGSAAFIPTIRQPGETIEFEFGAVKCYFKGEYLGTKVFVNVNGREVTSFIDKTPSKYDGRYIIAPILESEKETITVSTAQPTRRFTICAQDVVLLEDEITVFADKTTQIFVPMKQGFVLTSAKLDDQELSFEYVKGGYLLSVFETMQGETLLLETEEKSLSVSLPQTSDADFVGETRVPFGGTYTLSFTLKEGKKLTAFALGGVDLLSSLAYENGVYTLVLYTVTEDLVFTANFENASLVVNKTVGNGGSVTCAESVIAGGDLIITVTPDNGYYVVTLIVNGQNVSFDENGKYILQSVRTDVNIEATFAPIKKQEQQKSSEGCAGSVSGIGTTLLGLLMLGLLMLAITVKKEKNKND